MLYRMRWKILPTSLTGYITPVKATPMHQQQDSDRFSARHNVYIYKVLVETCLKINDQQII